MEKISQQIIHRFLCLSVMVLAALVMRAQSGIDYSSLSDASPADALETPSDYQEALTSGGWTSLNTTPVTSTWRAPAGGDYFLQSFYGLKVQPYESVLVSPALNLEKLSGQQLSFNWAANSVKGDIHLKVLIIDKSGNTLATLSDLTGEVGSKASDYNAVSASIPALTGTGFVAFYTSGDKDNRASFRVKDMRTEGGQQTVSVKATPVSLDFGTVKVGESSGSKEVDVEVSNFEGVVAALITSGDDTDFEVNTDALTASGGKIAVTFAPLSAGEKHAVLTIAAGDSLAEVSLSGLAETGRVAGPTVELLNDPYFYDFEGDTPKSWTVVGTPRKLDDRDRFSTDTGFGLGLTTDGQEGMVKQTINLAAADKEVAEGDEVECLVHYFTESTTRADGPFRLALRWLNAEGYELASAEKDFINNPDLYFGRQKAYGTLKFRTVCPAGAAQLEFAIVVAPHSSVRLDDLSALRLSDADRTPLVAVLPQYRTIYGEVGVAQAYPVALQGMHLASAQEPQFSGTRGDEVLSLDLQQLPANGTVAGNITVKPVQKGVFTMGSSAYGLSFGGADDENTGRLTFFSYFKGAGATPTVSVAEGATVREMAAEPGKTDTQTLELSVKNVINSVTVRLEQPAQGAFKTNTSLLYYSASKDTVYQNSVRVDFTPLAEGTYHATLLLYTEMADTLRIPLTGVAKRISGDGVTERFSADNPMDSRFTGEAWARYHKFDTGYWRLDGSWDAPNRVSLDAGGQLYRDEVVADGIISVGVKPESSAAGLSLEYSIDGGGHWSPVAAAAADGSFAVGTHRPTLLRLVNGTDASVAIDSIVIVPALEQDRQQFAGIAEAMIGHADQEALPLLNQTFTGLRHTRVLGLPGWQNLMLRGERPFYAWQQKDDAQTRVENECAQISFFRYGVTDDREQETWLVSPTLSYRKAAAKTLTFSLRFANPTEDGGEQFGFYIITENADKLEAHYLDLNDFLPEGVTPEAGEWFDYSIDLSRVEGLAIDDEFHVAFSFYSPKGGNATSLNFMVDDVSFGRTDLPTLSADRSMVTLAFQPGVEAAPEVVNIEAENATSPVTARLVPVAMGNFFKIATDALTEQGGPIGIGYKSDDDQQRAAMLLVQTRGAAPLALKLLATPVTNGIDRAADGLSQEEARSYTLDGKLSTVPVQGVVIVTTKDGKKYKVLRK